MNLSGRHVVISGGGSGVGADMAVRFADAGAKVSILGRRPEPLASISAQTGAFAASCDVTDRAALDDALAQCFARNGPVDVALANAGAASSVPFTKMTSQDLGAALGVNVVGVFNLWHATYQPMKTRGWGRLIAVASTAGLKGYPYVSGYCAAKHGVVGLVRALAVELGRTGVTVNALCPGFIETPLLERSIANIVEKTGMSVQDAASSLKSINPQRRFIQPEEVTGAALWLCTESARSVNGHALTISGGEV